MAKENNWLAFWWRTRLASRAGDQNVLSNHGNGGDAKGCGGTNKWEPPETYHEVS
jgi:hypothetical protein